MPDPNTNPTPFPLEQRLESEFFRPPANTGWEKRVNNLWDLCQAHLDHDLDSLRLVKDPDKAAMMLRDGMQQWSRFRERIVSTLIAGG